MGQFTEGKPIYDILNEIFGGTRRNGSSGRPGPGDPASGNEPKRS
jgi:hypothetical protein